MKRFALSLVIAALAAFILILPVSAAKPAPPNGTIAVAAGSDLSLGGVVTFDYTVSGGVNECYPYGSNKCARIQVLCFQAGVIVYGEAQMAPFHSFLLGGGSSDWKTNGGAVVCEATLYYWDFHPTQTFVPLAEPVLFVAEG
jgi:hypothetical protein